MNNVLSDALLKNELTPEQWETYQAAKEQYGLKKAMASLPEMDAATHIDCPTLNRRLKELRLEHGLSQNDIANILNISKKEYWRYEQEGYCFHISKLAMLAIFYNVSIDWISGYSSKRKPFFNENDFTCINGFSLSEFKEAKIHNEKYIPHTQRPYTPL